LALAAVVQQQQRIIVQTPQVVPHDDGGGGNMSLESDYMQLRRRSSRYPCSAG